MDLKHHPYYSISTYFLILIIQNYVYNNLVLIREQGGYTPVLLNQQFSIFLRKDFHNFFESSHHYLELYMLDLLKDENQKPLVRQKKKVENLKFFSAFFVYTVV